MKFRIVNGGSTDWFARDSKWTCLCDEFARIKNRIPSSFHFFFFFFFSFFTFSSRYIFHGIAVNTVELVFRRQSVAIERASSQLIDLLRRPALSRSYLRTQPTYLLPTLHAEASRPGRGWSEKEDRERATVSKKVANFSAGNGILLVIRFLSLSIFNPIYDCKTILFICHLF